jgi:hypothetical protein
MDANDLTGEPSVAGGPGISGTAGGVAEWGRAESGDENRGSHSRCRRGAAWGRSASTAAQYRY